MPSFRDTALRLYRKIFSLADGERLADGPELLLDGHSAVAVCEAGICEYNVLSGSALVEGAESAWRSESIAPGITLFGNPLHTLGSEGSSGAFAAAMGVALAGDRATLFLDGADFNHCHGLLHSAVSQHLSLVIHITTPNQGEAHSHSIQIAQQAMQSGAIVLQIGSHQDAVDLTLLARRASEELLTPVILLMPQTISLNAARVILPSPQLVEHYLGRSTDQITALNRSQQLLLGEQRRRLPIWHDPDRPLLNGAQLSSGMQRRSELAHQFFFQQDQIQHLDKLRLQLEKASGRHHSPLHQHGSGRQQHKLLVNHDQFGEICAQLKGVAPQLADRITLVAIEQISPLPVERLASVITDTDRVTVLENQNGDRSGLSLLITLLKPRIPAKSWHNVLFHGNATCPSVAELTALIERLTASNLPEQLYIGEITSARTDNQPKREVLQDELQRHYPALNNLASATISSTTSLKPASRPNKTIHIAVFHDNSEQWRYLHTDIGNLIHHLADSESWPLIQSRPALEGEEWGALQVDHLFCSASVDAADLYSLPLDIAVVCQRSHWAEIIPSLADRGLLISSTDITLDATLKDDLNQREIRALKIGHGDSSISNLREHLLGALFAELNQESQIPSNWRRLLQARRGYIQSLSAREMVHAEEALKEGYEDGDASHHLNADEVPISSVLETAPLPMAVRHYGNHHSRVDNLANFWNLVGSHYRDHDRKESRNPSGIDPYLATGTMPVLTSTFRSFAEKIDTLPQFNAPHCSGCGECWSYCPDSAIGVSALTPKAWLNHVLKQGGVDALRPLASTIIARMILLAKRREILIESHSGLHTLFSTATTGVIGEANLNDERRLAAEKAAELILARTPAVGTAATDTLFKNAEASQPGTGTLLSLAINPDACKGCGLCSDLCHDQALTMVPATTETVKMARTQWRGWEELPDSDSSTIQQARKQGMGDIASLMLSRSCAFPMAGGDSAEPASGAKIALRMLLATAEYQRQPRISQLGKRLAEQQESLTAEIRELLVEAMPTEDLDRLGAALKGRRSRQIDIGELTASLLQDQGQVGSQNEGQIDAIRLQRLIELNQSLADKHWQLLEGEQGQGRARYSLVIAASKNNSWCNSYPYNPFSVPTLVDNHGSAPQLALGLIQQQLKQAGEIAALLRDSRQELQRSASRAKANSKIPAWSELSKDERDGAAPILLIADAEELAGRSMAQLFNLLNSGLPVKVIAMNGLDFGLDTIHFGHEEIASSQQHAQNLALLALHHGRSYVAQCSISEPGHLQDALQQALEFSGPALVHLHTPSPQRHQFTGSEVLARAAAALRCRVLPLFSYHPEADGVFGSRLSLAGNPDINATYVMERVSSPENDDIEKEGDTELSAEELLHFGHWARGEGRFSAWFRPYRSDMGKAISLPEYLQLSESDRKRHTPVMALGGDEEVAIAAQMIKMAAECERNWRTLQELAGVVTPFTEQVRSNLQQEMQQQHQQELDQLRHDYEAKLAAQQQSLQGDFAQQLRDRLVTLAGYSHSQNQNGE